MDWLEKDLQELRFDLATVDTRLSEVLITLAIEGSLRFSPARTTAADMRVGLESALESMQGKEARACYYRGLE